MLSRTEIGASAQEVRGQHRLSIDRNILTTRTKREHNSSVKATAIPADPKSLPTPGADRLKGAADQAITACGGNVRNAVKALLVMTEFLEAQIAELQAGVSNGYARGKFEPVPRDRKDWYD
jgi:hypothetical protein